MKTLKEAIISRLVEGNDKIGDTIVVDGVSRPTKNSNGQLIHPTKQGIENFWRWFGDSKVVDAVGKPLVVYHGTGADFDSFDKGSIGKNYRESEDGGFFFTISKMSASNYAGLADGENTNVIPAYIKLERPYEFSANSDYLSPADYYDMHNISIIELVNNRNLDGVFISGTKKDDLVVALNPNQIKSAIGNTGDFNPKSSKINESKNKYYIIEDEDVSVQMDFNLKVTYDEETGEFDVIDLATNQEYPFGATTSQWNQMKDAVKKSGKKSTTVKMTLDVPLLASIYEEEGDHDIEFKDSETNEDYTSRVPKKENDRVFWELFKRYEKERKQSDEDDQAFDAFFYK